MRYNTFIQPAVFHYRLSIIGYDWSLTILNSISFGIEFDRLQASKAGILAVSNHNCFLNVCSPDVLDLDNVNYKCLYNVGTSFMSSFLPLLHQFPAHVSFTRKCWLIH